MSMFAPTSRTDMFGYDDDVRLLNVFMSFVADAAAAAGIGYVAYLLGAPGYAGAAIAFATFLLSTVVLRGLTCYSLGDYAAGLRYTNRATSGRPGIVRCAANEFLTLISLPFPFWAAEIMLSMLSERLSGLRISSTR